MEPWDKFWMAVMAVAVTGLFVFIGALVVSDKSVTGYYVSDPGSRGRDFCVVAAANWATDSAVFCSADIAKTLEVLKQSNELLPKKLP